MERKERKREKRREEKEVEGGREEGRYEGRREGREGETASQNLKKELVEFVTKCLCVYDYTSFEVSIH